MGDPLLSRLQSGADSMSGSRAAREDPPLKECVSKIYCPPLLMGIQEEKQTLERHRQVQLSALPHQTALIPRDLGALFSFFPSFPFFFAFFLFFFFFAFLPPLIPFPLAEQGT